MINILYVPMTVSIPDGLLSIFAPKKNGEPGS